MEWPKPTVFDARNVAPWVTVSNEPFKPDFADNIELKKAFGIAIGRGLSSFDAGLEVLNGDLPKGLWASVNWVRDPIVLAEKDAYIKALKRAIKPLDKEELLAEVLETSKVAPEFKDKAALLKLYSEIAGFTGKVNIDASTVNNNNTNNLTKIVLVGGSEDKLKTVNSPDNNIKSKIHNNLPQLKLVSGSGGSS
jgi:hypothetical protein